MPRLILADLLTPLLAPDDRLVVVDAGARDALADPRWAALRKARIHGFDPDAAECERLNAEAQAAGVDARYYPTALWSASGRFPFHANNAPGGGSFYEQRTDLTHRWQFECIDGQKRPARDLFFPTAIEDVEAQSLDDWAAAHAIPGVDFLKMNIQGAELQVLVGAAALMPTVLGVLAEVSFVESYRNRPMFADIDGHLRRLGFEFFDLMSFHQVGRIASPFAAQHAPAVRAVSMGQLIEAHALYLRDPLKPGLWRDTNARLIKLACLAEAFGQVEYAFEIVNALGETDDRAHPIFDAAAVAYQNEYGIRVAA